MSKFYGALILGTIAFVMSFVSATQAQQGEPIVDISQNVENTQETQKNVSPLEVGQYDEAYDYYTQGYYVKAFRAALRRAEQNDPIAQTLIGRMYMEGHVGPVDGKQAVLWFKNAANQGDPQAQLRYGLMLFEGTFIEKNISLAEEFIRKAMNSGVREAYFYSGQIHLYKAMHEQEESGKDGVEEVDVKNKENESIEQALIWFLKGASLGDPEAAFAAAKVLSVGTLTMPKNDGNARRLLEAAAQNKHLMAQVILAQWLLQGRGGESDFQRAFDLFLDNAYKNIVVAQVSLARLYRDGVGTSEDPITAAAWYLIAKSQKAEISDLETMIEGMDETQLQRAMQKAKKLVYRL
ncbi:tetratricopeptide repeat protein [Bartonella bilalgolemii]|uniref:Sel1 repeat family protein n=1 Tax=Bartonella bilalgolemii TaxID=2942911 RepID=A0ABT0P6W3_9HYPH|nr:tetratricopeptide repeat protein [Bartonella sp. G70]MCL6229201.1 sel1 repeat family protein [Bartonella sp. G70]